MRIIVKAKSSAKEDKVERLTQPTLGFDREVSLAEIYKVSVKAVPVDGKANEAITKLLAKYFKVPISSVQLISGRASKQKIFDITAS